MKILNYIVKVAVGALVGLTVVFVCSGNSNLPAVAGKNPEAPQDQWTLEPLHRSAGKIIFDAASTMIAAQNQQHMKFIVSIPTEHI